MRLFTQPETYKAKETWTSPYGGASDLKTDTCGYNVILGAASPPPDFKLASKAAVLPTGISSPMVHLTSENPPPPPTVRRRAASDDFGTRGLEVISSTYRVSEGDDTEYEDPLELTRLALGNRTPLPCSLGQAAPPRQQTSLEDPSLRSGAAESVHSPLRIRTSKGACAWWFDSGMAGRVRLFLRGRFWTILSVFAICLALLLPDLFTAMQVSSNMVLDVILTLVFGLFIFELFALTLVESTYFNSFVFWMDIFGTASIIFDLSYCIGNDATEPEYSNSRRTESGQSNLWAERPAQVAKLAGRAGRLSRVLKVLRHLPACLGTRETEKEERKTAKVISNQVTNKVSTRVAFLVIGLCVMIPTLTSLTKTEIEESMRTWAQLLSKDGGAFFKQTTAAAKREWQSRISEELVRFVAFYQHNRYGPFEVCFRSDQLDTFDCFSNQGISVKAFEEAALHKAPSRRSSIRVMREAHLQASFDMSTPQTWEALSSITLIILIVVAINVFSITTSRALGVIVLDPVERMVSLVKVTCNKIFKYSEDLGTNISEIDEEEDGNEVMMLEKAVAKLSAIASLTLTKKIPDKKELTEADRMQLAFMAHGRSSVFLEDDASPKGIIAVASEMQVKELDNIREALMEDPFLSDHLAKLETGEFDSWAVSESKQRVMAEYIMYYWGISSVWGKANVPQKSLAKFLNMAAARYPPNPFHNFSHALDVLYQVCVSMELIRAQLFLPEAPQFWLPLAAVAHDLGHPAVNNQYLIEISHSIALTYNDKSPLENMHCSTLFKILKEGDANVFCNLDTARYKDIRSGLIEAILHTDMIFHIDMVKDLAMLLALNEDAFKAHSNNDRPPSAFLELFTQQSNVQLILNMLLHCADVGNPMKPWDMCKRLAYLCLDEFFAQGDMEKKAGIPVQMLNDRDKVNPPNSQIGFIEFVIAPLAEKVTMLFPELGGLAINLHDNLRNWVDIWASESSPDADTLAKTNLRVQRVSTRLGTALKGRKPSGYV